MRSARPSVKVGPSKGMSDCERRIASTAALVRPELLRRCIVNLVENALRHTRTDVELTLDNLLGSSADPLLMPLIDYLAKNIVTFYLHGYLRDLREYEAKKSTNKDLKEPAKKGVDAALLSVLSAKNFAIFVMPSLICVSESASSFFIVVANFRSLRH